MSTDYPVVSRYRLRRRVQFYETDTAGIVHFSWFYRYMEEAEHALWRAAGLSIAPPNAHIGFPRVAASFDFFKPLRFEDEFEVELTIAEISTKAIRYRAEIVKDGVKVASGRLTVACVRKQPGQPMTSTAIPDEISSRFRIAEPPQTAS
jgi:YbgC/YbaW family acyl-CoA thioester hydrolase